MKVYPARLLSKAWEVVMVMSMILLAFYLLVLLLAFSELNLIEKMVSLLFLSILIVVTLIVRALAHRSAAIILYNDRVEICKTKQFLFGTEQMEFGFNDVSRMLLKVGYRSRDYAVIWLKDGRKLMIDQHFPIYQMHFDFEVVSLVHDLAGCYNIFNEQNNISAKAELRIARPTTNNGGVFSLIVDIFSFLD